MMKVAERETDGRFQLQLSSKRSYANFIKREREREAARQRNYQDALDRGLSQQQAEEEMYLFA